MENVNYPKELFKYRYGEGVVRYQQVEGNLYEDTTCRHSGDKCRIKVSKSTDHYDLSELSNDSAIKYKEYHVKGERDSSYYDCMEKAMIFYTQSKINQYNESLSSVTDEYVERLSKLRLLLGNTTSVSINDLDYNDDIYICKDSKSNSGTHIKDSDKIVNKVYSEKGLDSLNTTHGYKITSRHHVPFFIVEVPSFYDGYLDYETHLGFKSEVDCKKVSNSQLGNQLCSELIFLMEEIDSYSISIKQLNNEVEKYINILVNKDLKNHE